MLVLHFCEIGGCKKICVNGNNEHLFGCKNIIREEFL